MQKVLLPCNRETERERGREREKERERERGRERGREHVTVLRPTLFALVRATLTSQASKFSKIFKTITCMFLSE